MIEVLISSKWDETEADKLINEAKGSCFEGFISYGTVLVPTSEVICIYKQSVKEVK